MTRTTRLIVMLASCVVCLSAPAFAQSDPQTAPAAATASSGAAAPSTDAAAQTQETPVNTDFHIGEIKLDLTARPDVARPKFEEYRRGQGVSLPAFRLFGSQWSRV
jgi:hypothetical protein